jgi:hypothetical protein
VESAIKVEGLNQTVRALKKLDAEIPKTLRVAFNNAADIVVSTAQPRVPTRTGRARASIKARSVRTAVRVQEGGARAPYMPWLDFGGRTGKKKSVVRPFLKEGRYVWWAFAQKKGEVLDAALSAITDAAEAAGLEVE